MQHAYAVTNRVAALADAALTWGTGGTTNRSYLRDGRVDRAFSAGAATGGTTLVIDFGSAVALTCVAVLNSNIAQASGTPTLKVEAADDSGFSVNLVTAKAQSTLNVTAPRQKDHVLQFASVTKRYWRLTWTWTGSFSLSVGEVFAGTLTALARAHTYGLEEREEFEKRDSVGDGGETWSYFFAGPVRCLDLVWEDLSESERDELRLLFRSTSAGATPVLWCPSYESVATAAAADQQDVLYGHFVEKQFGATEFDFDRYNPGGLTLRNMGREVGA